MSAEVIAYFLALFVGITLGLVGAGGSILTLPILVKVAGIEPKFATTYSNFIVGFTAMIGAYTYYRKDLLHFKSAFVFLIPCLFSAFLMKKYAMPLIPDEIVELDTIILTKDFMILVIFGIVMLLASVSMIRGKQQNLDNQDIKNIDFNLKAIFYQGLLVGVLTALVGAGGGFLIVPSLVRFAKLPIRLTIGTSLFIITVNSLMTFGISISSSNMTIDWEFLLLFAGISAIGLFIGMYISQYIKADHLKKSFGYFVLIMAIYSLARELLGVFIL